MRYKGLTWDHPRGFNALAAAQRAGGPIDWEVQPLEGFESAPIADLCARYDLVVLDHPHLGEALAADCLQPLTNLFSESELETIAIGAIGPAFVSYTMADQQWALPLDAATQVMALRPDLSNRRPHSWADVITLSDQGLVGMSLAGPHACLSLMSIVAALAPDLNMADGDWPSQATLESGYEMLAQLAAQSPASILDKNPIAILEHMARADDVALVPLIYGYVNYANPKHARPILFCDAPCITPNRPGSIIGGTGIALSKRAQLTEELRSHLLWLLSPDTQTGFIPDHDGQPGLECAWRDRAVNKTWGDFYKNTHLSLQSSTIRPRHNGYIAFQSQASAYLRDAMASKVPAKHAAQTLTEMFANSQTAQRTQP